MFLDKTKRYNIMELNRLRRDRKNTNVNVVRSNIVLSNENILRFRINIIVITESRTYDPRTSYRNLYLYADHRRNKKYKTTNV